jgi:hypothetical protein
MSLGSCFKSKWPEDCINHLRPHSNAMEEKGSGRQSEHLIFIFDNAILMVSAYGTKGNLLVLPIDLFKKTFVCKCTIIRMVVLNSLTAIGPYFAHSFFWLCSRLITFLIFVR